MKFLDALAFAVIAYWIFSFLWAWRENVKYGMRLISLSSGITVLFVIAILWLIFGG